MRAGDEDRAGEGRDQGAVGALDVDATVAQARSFAERIYSIFRWAVTDEFLRRYGGQP